MKVAMTSEILLLFDTPSQPSSTQRRTAMQADERIIALENQVRQLRGVVYLACALVVGGGLFAASSMQEKPTKVQLVGEVEVSITDRVKVVNDFSSSRYGTFKIEEK